MVASGASPNVVDTKGSMASAPNLSGLGGPDRVVRGFRFHAGQQTHLGH